MDSEIVYSLFGIIGLSTVIYLVLQSTSKKVSVKTKTQKKAEIISEYKKRLSESLVKFENDQEARKKEKSILLKKYSDELSRNIFFDQGEIREIILDLSSS